MQRVRRALLMLCVVVCWDCQGSAPTTGFSPQPFVTQSAVAPLVPMYATVAYISQHPLLFDGQLVRVRAWLNFGWEGDNFLYDPPDRSNPKKVVSRGPAMWFYCKPGSELLVYGSIRPGTWRVHATFTGYFHLVPDQKSRFRGVFDPGPLQLETIQVSDLDPLSK
jgi:hypothetical protein